MYERLQRKPLTTLATQAPLRDTRLQPPQGTRAVLRLPVGAPDHAAERDADRIADRVMQSTSAEAALQPSAATDLVSDARAGARSVAAGPVTDLSGYLGPGQPLDQSVRAFAGPRFSFDFSRVRIHADERAAAAAAALDARAFTYGSSIAFGPGEYRPLSTDGQRLIAHELAHVVQQSTTSNAGIVRRQPGEPGARRKDSFAQGNRCGPGARKSAQGHGAGRSKGLPFDRRGDRQAELSV